MIARSAVLCCNFELFLINYDGLTANESTLLSKKERNARNGQAVQSVSKKTARMWVAAHTCVCPIWHLLVSLVTSTIFPSTRTTSALSSRLMTYAAVTQAALRDALLKYKD